MKNLIYTMLFSLFLLIGALPVSANEEVTVKYVQYSGASLYTEVYNYNSSYKEAIIYLHGLGGNHTDGSFLFDKNNDFMTITLDLPNHGNSGKYDNITWDTYTDAVKAVIDEYGLKKVHLVGHSFGADTAMMFAKKYPKDVTDLILLDRSYYNFSDVIQYNFTPSFYKIVEYNPDSGLDTNSFYTLLDMLFENDITQTWDIKKDVLLVAANPYWPAPVEGEESIIDFISYLKQYPAEFGITEEQAAELPDLTLDNLYDYMEFLKTKINGFTQNNKRFHMVQTPFEHAMVYNDSAKPEILNYVLEFINNKDKNLAENNINKKIKENKGKYKSRSLMEILEID